MFCGISSATTRLVVTKDGNSKKKQATWKVMFSGLQQIHITSPLAILKLPSKAVGQVKPQSHIIISYTKDVMLSRLKGLVSIQVCNLGYKIELKAGLNLIFMFNCWKSSYFNFT